MSENVPTTMSAQQRFRSACASSLSAFWTGKDTKIRYADNKDSDQIALMGHFGCLGSHFDWLTSKTFATLKAPIPKVLPMQF